MATTMTNQPPPNERPLSVNLHCKNYSSDKVYNIQLEYVRDICRDTAGWIVKFQYGKRHGTLVSGVKNLRPLSYYGAKNLFDKLVYEKKNKGYLVVGHEGIENKYELEGRKVNVPEKVKTDFEPMHPVEISLEAAASLFNVNAGNLYMQIKYDGERRGIKATDNIVPSNKLGFQTDVRTNIMDALKTLTENWTEIGEFDTEDMGSHLVIFDVMQMGGENAKNYPFRVRHTMLNALNIMLGINNLRDSLKVDAGFCPANMEEFTQFIDYAKRTSEEGVVLRTGDGVYIPGKLQTSGVYKLKFVASGTFEVSAQNSNKRSVSILARGNDRLQSLIGVGNVTIPEKYDIPERGSLIEVQYLYRNGVGGSLIQPVFKGVRTDSEKADCVDTLQYKKDN